MTTKIFDIYVHKDETKLKDLRFLIGKECGINTNKGMNFGIIKNIVIDTHTWFHIYDFIERREVVVRIEDICLERGIEEAFKKEEENVQA